MQHSRAASVDMDLLNYPDPLQTPGLRPELRALPRAVEAPAAEVPPVPRHGHINASILSFQNMHLHGDLLVTFLRARKRTFIDRLNWDLAESDGMEFDQYDTPLSRWIVVHEFGEVLGGFRMTPTTARCGIYSYMLRDAQKGLLESIPTDVLFFEAPVSDTIWEATRLFIVDHVTSQRRMQVQSIIMENMSLAAQEMGAKHVIGIVPAVWSRWLRRLALDAVPVGPRFAIDGTISQAALFKTSDR